MPTLIDRISFDLKFSSDIFGGVFAKCGKFFVVSALVLLIGGQWTLLQSVAWIRMTIENSQTLPFKQALIKTFDGQHPCCLCKIVASAKKSEKKEQTDKPTTKLDLFCFSNSFKFAVIQYGPIHPVISHWTARLDSPPTPPPLAA